ncbi:MAG: SDR family oxidoreductase [Burkholderiales bacterium]|nr:SDR family oxidoreductase [Burkholderiales bacterium]
MTSNTPPGKTALITGASRGIGAAVAIALARRGIATALAVRRPEAAHEVLRAVTALGLPCLVVACDVASERSVRQAVDAVLASWGRLDVVINNAGQIEPIGHMHETEPVAWANAVQVNLVGAYNVIYAALPALLRVKGSVVNVSTGAAHTPREGWSAYCSSKAALAMLTRCVATEYAPRGVCAYGLQPGLVDTEMQVRIRASGMNEISRVPREKLAPPERAAGVIAWIADERPGDLVGQDLALDEALLERALAAHP